MHGLNNTWKRNSKFVERDQAEISTVLVKGENGMVLKKKKKKVGPKQGLGMASSD